MSDFHLPSALIGGAVCSAVTVAVLFTWALCIVSADADRALELATDEDAVDYRRAENVVPIERARVGR